MHTEAVASGVRRAGLRLLPFMAVLYVVNYLDRVNVGVAAVRMNADIGLSATAFGLGAGLLFVGYVAFEVPSNLILRRVGVRRWMTVITASWGACAAGTAFVQDPLGFYVLRFLLGVCEAGFLPGMMLYLTYWFPREYRGRFTALFMLALPVTLAVGTPVSTLLMGVENVFWLGGWRFMLFVEGAVAVLLAALVPKLLPDGPEHARWLPDEQRAALQDALAAERQHIEPHGRGTLAAALRDYRVYAVGLIGFGMSGGVYALTFFLPQIVADFQAAYGVELSVYDIGLITAIPAGVSVAAMALYARRSDRTGERIRHIALPLLPAALALGAALYLDSPVLVMAAITITVAGSYMVLPVWWQLPGMFLTGSAAAGGIGIIAALGNTSGFVAPYLTGWLRDLTGDYRVGMLVIAALMVLAAAGALLLGRDPAFQRFDTGAPVRQDSVLRTRS